MKQLKYIKPFKFLNKDEDKLFDAITKHNINKVKNLIEVGVNVNAFDSYSRTALHFAVSQPGNIEIVQFLIEAGANLNAKNDWGQTPLCVASQYNSLFDYVKLLIEANADWNIMSIEGEYFLDILAPNHKEYVITHYRKMYKDFLLEKDLEKYNL